MSKQVDERVVSMQFDNANFEKNVSTTMSTLDKLKQKLKLDDSVKSFDNVNKSVKNVDISSLSRSVETVSSKFSALEVMGVTALANITNSAVNASKRMLASFTIDPVKTGFQEYELKMGSVQTIMESTGASLEEVNGYLSELNEYSDKTIYSFSDMTNNIGKFTNAGVKLDQAVLAIKGVSNEAAISGANANEASRAMYNFAQALSSGYVKLIDWKSIENANMATVEFKQQLINTAVEIGTLTKTADGMYATSKRSIDATHNFNDSLQDQWMTTDVLVTTLSKYADETTDIGKKAYAAAQDVKTFSMMMDTLKEAAQSGWAETWEILVGDFEEAKTLWTDLSNMFGDLISSSASSRNNFLKSVFGGSGSKWSDLTSQIEKTGVSVSAFEEKFKEVARSHGIAIDDMIKDEGSLANVINSGKLKDLPGLVKETFKSFMEGGLELSGTTKQITTDFEHMQEVVLKVINGDFGNGADRINAMAEAGENWAQAQALVDYIWERNGHTWDDCSLTLDEMTKIIGNLSDEELKSAGYTKEQIDAFKELAKQAQETGTPINELIENMSKPSGRELLIDTFRNAIKGLITVINSIKGAWKDIFPPENAANGLYKIIETIHKFSEYLNINDEKADQLKRTFKGLFAIIDLIRRVVGGGLNIAFKILKAVCSAFNIDVLELTARIGDAVVKFRDWINEHDYLSKAIQFVVRYISKAVIAVKDWIKNNESLQKGLKKIKDFVKDSGSAIKDWFDGIKDAENIPKYILSGLTKGLEAGIKTVVDTFINLGKAIIDAIKNVLGIHSPSTEFFEIGKNIIQGLINGIKEGASSVIEFFKEFGSKVIETFEKIDFGKVFAATLGVGLFVISKGLVDAIGKIATAIENVSSLVGGVGKLLSGAGSALSGLGQSLKSNKWKNIGKMVLDMAIAIGILAASLYLISKIDPERLWESVGVLSVLVGVMAAFSIAVSILADSSEPLNAGKISIMVLSIGATMLILASVLKKIDKLKHAERSLKTLGIIAAGLLAFVIILSKLSDFWGTFNMKEIGKMLVKMSVALLLMVFVIKIISKMNPGDIAKGIFVITLFGGLFVGLTALTKLAGPEIDKVGGMLLKMALTMGMMVIVIKLIAGISESDILKGILTMAAFGLLFAEFTLVSRLAGENGSKAGSSLLMIATAMLIMIGVIKLISFMEPEDIKKGLGVISILGVLFAGLIAVSNLAGENAVKAGAMLLMAAGALLIVTGILFIISQMNPEGLGRALGIITVLEILFGGLIAVTKLAENVKMGTLITLVVGIGVLALALVGLSFIDPERLLSAASAMSMVMIAFGGMIALTKFAGNAKGMAKNLLLILGVVVVLGGIITALALLDPGSALTTTAALSLLMLSLSTSMILISKASGVSAKTIGNFALMGLVVAELASILGLMSYLNVEASIPSAIALSILLNAMASAMLILESAINVTAGTVGKMLLLGLVVAELSVILGGMSYLNVEASIPTAIALSILLNAMASAMLILDSVIYVSAETIGKMALLGLVVAELAVILGVMDALNVTPSIETALALSTLLLAMSASLLILAGVGLAGPAAFIGIVALATLIAGIGGLIIGIGALMTEFPKLEEFLNKGIPILGKIGEGIGSFFGGIVAGFATELLTVIPAIGQSLSDFITNANPFLQGVNSIDPAAAEGAKTLAEMILILTAADLIQGITSFITGGSSIADFGTEIAGFGSSLKTFSDNVEGINPENIKAASEAGKALAEMASTIPNEGGVVGWFAGENSISKFGDEIATFGTNLKEFSDNVNGIDPESIKAAAEAGKALAEMADTIPNEGGVAAWFAGENSISKFGTDIATFGSSLKAFSDNVNGIVPENIKAASEAGKNLAEMASTIPNEGGVAAWFAGENSISKFGDEIATFGTNLKAFSDNLTGINPENIKSASQCGKTLANMMATISDSGVDDVDDFNKLIVEFGQAMSDFQTKITKVNSEAIKLKVNDFKSAINSLKNVSSTSLDELVESFSSVKDDISKAVDDIVSTIKKKKSDFKSAGEELTKNLSEGLKSKKSDIKKTIYNSKLDNVVSEIKKKKSDFKTAGKNLGEGLVNGINDKQQAVYDAAYALGQKAVQGEKDGQQSESPSKLTYQSGIWFGEGLVNGIDRMSSAVYSEAKDLGTTATGGLSKAIAKISDIIDSDIDTQPTIRPVLDLSGVAAGAGRINGMFDMNPSVGVMANVRSISASMNNRQNGETDVVSAIKDLGKQIGKTSGDTYTINGVTYDDGSNISSAVKELVRAARIERRT